jgi:hypothetical protein
MTDTLATIFDILAITISVSTLVTVTYIVGGEILRREKK